MSNSDYKFHITLAEKNRWNKVVDDFGKHLKSGGDENHVRANGTVPGFSINDYTWDEKNKLAGIEKGALNNPHPDTHPYTMITGLSTVAHTGSYTDLLNIPSTFKAGGGNSDTVGGIRFTVGPNAPGSPKVNQDVWFNTSEKLIYVYHAEGWIKYSAVFNK